MSPKPSSKSRSPRKNPTKAKVDTSKPKPTGTVVVPRTIGAPDTVAPHLLHAAKVTTDGDCCRAEEEDSILLDTMDRVDTQQANTNQEPTSPSTLITIKIDPHGTVEITIAGNGTQGK